ncbi:hypothetical protein HQ520_12170 [bacterium]|nr:hypothetical protein [bacterium]
MTDNPEKISIAEDGTPPVREGRGAWWIVPAWAALVIVVLVLGLAPLRASHDEWWHLKTGKWIVEHGFRVPDKDIFTYTASDYEWENHEWLSQVVMYLAWRWGDTRTIGGWRAVILLKALVLVATYLLLGRFLWQRCGRGARGAIIAVSVTLLAVAVGKRMFYPRPPVITNLFVVFFLYSMWLHRAGRLKTRHLFVLPVLMPVWANLHGGFLVGGIVIAAYFAGESGEWVWLRLRGSMDAEGLRAKLHRAGVYLGLGVLCGLASLLNPWGYHLYFLTQRVMSSRDLVIRLGELAPPDFRFTWAYGFLLAFLAVGFTVLIVGGAIGKVRRWPPLGELLLLLFFFWQSIHHVRHLLLFGLVAAPVATWMLREAWAGRVKRRGSARGMAWLTGGATVALAAWLLFFPGEALGVWKSWQEPGRIPLGPSASQRAGWFLRGMSEEPGSYPRQAVNFVLKAHLPGRMYNRNNVSGYLIWALSPEHYRLFTDSRFDIFGQDFLMDEMSVANGYPAGYLEPFGTPVRDWREVIEDYAINWLFLDRGEAIHGKLFRGQITGWALVYIDDQYAIWLRRAPENDPWIERYGIETNGLSSRELKVGI